MLSCDDQSNSRDGFIGTWKHLHVQGPTAGQHGHSLAFSDFSHFKFVPQLDINFKEEGTYTYKERYAKYTLSLVKNIDYIIIYKNV